MEHRTGYGARSDNVTIGIIGGMGAAATSDLFKKIIDNTHAENDSSHFRVCIDSNTNIPDRTAAILYGGRDPVPEIVRSAILLESMGADFLLMPCNTAHFFYNRISTMTRIPIVNMLQETAEEAANQNITCAGLLATVGTIQSKIYEEPLRSKGIRLVYPSKENQNHVMDLIYKGIKASNNSIDLTGFLAAIDDLVRAGAQTMILGCTELPVAFEMYSFQCRYIDPTLVLARSAVRIAERFRSCH